MTQATLRKLATDYAKGMLAEEEYRQARAELLEGILSGEIALQVNDYPPPVVPDQDDDLDITIEKQPKKENSGTAPSSAEPPASPAPASDSGKDKKKFIMAGAGLLVVIVIASAWFPDAKQTKTAKNATTGKMASAEQNMSATQTSQAAQTLIQGFLKKKDWSDTSLNQFKLQWQALTAEQRAGATGSVQLGQLTNAIYKKLLEERALSGLGSAQEALNKQRKLLAFAENIGINDARIRLPEGQP